ncbi:enoyl-CoA hydratase [Hephaestia caeni]|uniref:Enoyl-CoA hydratase n=2 Tax=Hephaestia caeni TaxID=645617 RepID=A0A397NTX0_9SPHN|nr:enoyl-CoA hydratase [Hephaestia caeni]
MVAPEILLERADAVAIVTLNRPDRMNAVHLPMMIALADMLADLEGDDAVGAIVLTGAGRGFCAGGDVKNMAARGPRSFEGRVADLKQMHRVPALIRAMPKVVVAAVNGPAAGAGFTLAAACDLRIAAASARFSTSFAKVGLSGDMGGSHTLPRLIGPTLARDLYLTSRSVDAEEALRIGLVSEIAADEECLPRAIARAREIAAGPRLAYGYIKRNLLAAESAPFERMLEIEAIHQQRCADTADHAEAKRAFVEKRSPHFEGR